MSVVRTSRHSLTSRENNDKPLGQRSCVETLFWLRPHPAERLFPIFTPYNRATPCLLVDSNLVSSVRSTLKPDDWDNSLIMTPDEITLKIEDCEIQKVDPKHVTISESQYLCKIRSPVCTRLLIFRTAEQMWRDYERLYRFSL